MHETVYEEKHTCLRSCLETFKRLKSQVEKIVLLIMMKRNVASWKLPCVGERRSERNQRRIHVIQDQLIFSWSECIIVTQLLTFGNRLKQVFTVKTDYKKTRGKKT